MGATADRPLGMTLKVATYCYVYRNFYDFPET